MARRGGDNFRLVIEFLMNDALCLLFHHHSGKQIMLWLIKEIFRDLSESFYDILKLSNLSNRLGDKLQITKRHSRAFSFPTSFSVDNKTINNS